MLAMYSLLIKFIFALSCKYTSISEIHIVNKFLFVYGREERERVQELPQSQIQH